MPLTNIVQNKKFQSDICRRKRVSVKFFVFDPVGSDTWLMRFDGKWSFQPFSSCNDIWPFKVDWNTLLRRKSADSNVKTCVIVLQGLQTLSGKSNFAFSDLYIWQNFINMGLFWPKLKHNFADMGPDSKQLAGFIE